VLTLASLPRIGIGTWNMERDDPSSAVAAIRRALEHGMIHVDTAELYGRGRVEELVREAIAGFPRERLFLTSKVLPNHANREGTLRACEASLRRLGVEYLDLYLLHWSGSHPLAETFQAFAALEVAGKIRAYGVSNFDDAELDAAEAAARAVGGRVACNQVLYHLNERAIEHRVVPWCRAHGAALVGYSPFGSRGGFGADTVQRLAPLAQRLGKTPRQLALAFLVRGGAYAIPKSSQPAHVDELAGAQDLVLDAAAITEIDRAFPRSPWRGLPTI
jgi:diketogulonate reductase-like aldo/keto reductase